MGRGKKDLLGNPVVVGLLIAAAILVYILDVPDVWHWF